MHIHTPLVHSFFGSLPLSIPHAHTHTHRLCLHHTGNHARTLKHARSVHHSPSVSHAQSLSLSLVRRYTRALCTLPRSHTPSIPLGQTQTHNCHLTRPSKHPPSPTRCAFPRSPSNVSHFARVDAPIKPEVGVWVSITHPQPHRTFRTPFSLSISLGSTSPPLQCCLFSHFIHPSLTHSPPLLTRPTLAPF